MIDGICGHIVSGNEKWEVMKLLTAYCHNNKLQLFYEFEESIYMSVVISFA